MANQIDTDILTEVFGERQHQDDKYGENVTRYLPLLEWWAILSEEYGEAAHDLVDYFYTPDIDPVTKANHLAGLRKELLQTAACCVAMVGRIDQL